MLPPKKNRIDGTNCKNGPNMEPWLRFDSNTETATCWNRIPYGPMESTYQHDYKTPILAAPTIKVGPPPSSVFWNQSMSYGPMESTYQHDFKRPAIMSPASSKINIPMPVLSAYWNCRGIVSAAPSLLTTYQADYKNPFHSTPDKAVDDSTRMVWNTASASFVQQVKNPCETDFEESTISGSLLVL